MQRQDATTSTLELFDVDRNVLTRITFGTDLAGFPIWTRDSQRIVYTLGRAEGPGNIFSKSADGTGRTERLTTTNGTSQLPASWSADGRTLVFMEFHAGSNTLDTAMVSLDPPSQPRKLIPAGIYPEVSPDGRWIAYSAAESGARSEVFVRPFPNVDDGLWQLSTSGGDSPVWRPDGTELFYRSATSMMRVPIQTGSTFRWSSPEVLFDAPYRGAGFGRVRPWDVSSDGQRFLMIKESAGATNDSQIVVVEHWLEDLKRLVP